MRSAQAAAFGVALLVTLVPAFETGEAIPWCVAPDTYVTQPPLCSDQDDDTYSIEFISNAPRTWCQSRNLLAAMNLPFGDLQFDCYQDDKDPNKGEVGSACMQLPHGGQEAVCDYSSGHGQDEARCTDVLDGAMLAGDDGARATSLALTTSRGRIVLANLNTDESASFQASSGGALDGFGASPLRLNGTVHTNVLWGADTGSPKLMVWTGASGDTSVSLCTEIDVGGAIQATVSLPLEGGGLAIGVLLKPTSPREAVMHFYEAPVGGSDACSSRPNSTSVVPQRRATWKVKVDPSSTGTLRLMSLQHQRHDMSAMSLAYNNIMCFPAEEGSVRNLVVLYDAKHVAFYHHDHLPVATDADPNELALNFGSLGDASLFYTAPTDRRLVSVTAWGSCTSSDWKTIAQASGSILQRSQYPAQLLWLAVATELSDAVDPSSEVEVRALPEFALAATECLIEPSNHFYEKKDPAYRAAHPAWRCADPFTKSCCGEVPLSPCDDPNLFKSSDDNCVPRAILNVTNTPALSVPSNKRVVDLVAGQQTVNEGAWTETDISLSASSFSSQLDSFGLADQAAALGDGLSTNLTNSSANTSKILSRLNTVKCGLSACDISEELHDVLFMAFDNRTVKVVAIQEPLCRGTGRAEDNILVSELNQIYTAGDPRKLLAAPNAQHLIVIQMYRKWQLNSRERLSELCQNASDMPDDQFFSIFAPACGKLSSRKLNLWDFLAYYSACRPGHTCPSIVYPNASEVARGSFTARPLQNSGQGLPCPKGYFCIGGTRIACLPGYICPQTNLSFPQRCEADPTMSTTCYGEGLIDAQLCQPGFSCVTPASQPWGAPPGRYLVDYPRDTLYNCSGGDWCPYARHNVSNTTDGNTPVVVDMHCPDNFYCITPSVSKPGDCYEEDDNGDVNRSSIKYCPKGTQFPEYCPAGNQCEMPNTTEPCTQSYYCPAGTAIEGLCPAGTPCLESKPHCQNGA